MNYETRRPLDWRDYADAIGGIICIAILMAPFVALAWR